MSNLELSVISKKDAGAAGKKRFFTGIACPNGHIAERYIWSGSCVVCSIARAKSGARRTKQSSEARRRYHRERVERDPSFVLSCRIRSLITSSLRVLGHRKAAKTEAILGCTLAEFKTHIERQFLPDMGWHNRSMWELDHIVPMATATTEAEAIALNHFTNLRPLWTPDNRKKSDEITHLL